MKHTLKTNVCMFVIGAMLPFSTYSQTKNEAKMTDDHNSSASASMGMTHIAITNYQGDTNVVWLKPVTQQEYNAVQ